MNKQILTAATFVTAAMIVGQSPATAAADGATKSERERGVVMECTGEADGLQAYASLYENDRHGNYVQVVLGDLDAGNGESKQVKRPFLRGGKVRAQIKVAGKRATIRGTASKVGKKEHVHEELDDAGYHIVSDGNHRRLANDLVLRYDGAVVPLTCDPAFAYKLQVTKTPIG